MIGLGLGFLTSTRGSRQEDDEDDMPRRYLFVDGGFFRSFVEEMKETAKREHGELEIQLSRIGSQYDRVFFYDAYPEKRDSQSDQEFELERERTETYFGRISTTPNFSVRPALTRRGQRRQQKGVDVLLAIECLIHALRNNIDEATVMTSDLDFFPLFEALLQTKTKSTLRYQIQKTAPELIQAADFAKPLTFVDFHDWLPKDLKIFKSAYSISHETAEKSQVVASGSVGDRPYKLMKCDDPEGFFSVIDGRLFHNVYNCRLYVEALAEDQMRAQIRYDQPPA